VENAKDFKASSEHCGDPPQLAVFATKLFLLGFRHLMAAAMSRGADFSVRPGPAILILAF
jgi:hypothetical protein